jgi:hypothetical protein
MEAQMRLIAATGELSMPVYLSLITPLVGTEMFWEDIAANRLAANLRLRDLDGETIAYSEFADTPERTSAFVAKLFRRPVSLVGRRVYVLKLFRRIVASKSFNLFKWYVRVAPTFRFAWTRAFVSSRKTFFAGENVLDPQYFEFPADISDADWRLYFEPVAVTDARGQPAPWLRPYLDERLQRASLSAGQVGSGGATELSEASAHQMDSMTAQNGK